MIRSFLFLLLQLQLSKCNQNVETEVFSTQVSEEENMNHETKTNYIGMRIIDEINISSYQPIYWLTSEFFPQNIHPWDICFWYYQNETLKQMFKYNETHKLLSYGFIPIFGTIILIPDFLGHCQEVYLDQLGREILKLGLRNVICVDWKAYNRRQYGTACANSFVVADIIALLIENINLLTTPIKINKKIHFIGHGIGAHIGGRAASKLQEIGRVSGLDPTGNFFKALPPSQRLDSNDANIVDVIHTHGGGNYSPGILTPSGHVDFYPNGGQKQPGCNRFLWELLMSLQIFIGMPINRYRFICSHLRAVLLFTASITERPCFFWSFNCKNFEEFKRGECFNSKTRSKLGFSYDMNRFNKGNKYLLTLPGPNNFCGSQYLISIIYKPESCNTTAFYRGEVFFTYQNRYGKRSQVSLLRDFMAPGFLKTVIILDSMEEVRFGMLYKSYAYFFKINKLKVDFVNMTSANGTNTTWIVPNGTLFNGKDTLLQLN